jgi:hypothetical protein
MRPVCWFAVAGVILSSHVNAQVMIDMTKVTCSDYLAMPADKSSVFSAWMSGYFNQKHGYSAIDLDGIQRNTANLKQWCTSNPSETVINAIQKAFILKQ